MKLIPLSAQLLMGIYAILVIAHISAFLGITPTNGNIQDIYLLAVFFFALIPFWLILIFKLNHHVNFSHQAFLLKKIKENIPPWMLKMTYIAFGYGIISFAFTFVKFATPNPEMIKDNVFHFRAFSAHLSIFYAVTVTGLTGLANYRPKKCSNGHEIRIEARHCLECGVSVDEG